MAKVPFERQTDESLVVVKESSGNFALFLSKKTLLLIKRAVIFII